MVPVESAQLKQLANFKEQLKK